MKHAGSAGPWQRFDLLEQSVCLRLNRTSRHRAISGFFTLASRLGDGPAWYLLMLALACSGETGAMIAAQMASTGVAGLAIYRQLKRRLVRERPYLAHQGIVLGALPLDRYSFPSGHTLHAVAFTLIATVHVPALAPVLVPFVLAVAGSRVVLGLHYPTDVAAGALIGATLATISLSIWPS